MHTQRLLTAIPLLILLILLSFHPIKATGTSRIAGRIPATRLAQSCLQYIGVGVVSVVVPAYCYAWGVEQGYIPAQTQTRVFPLRKY